MKKFLTVVFAATLLIVFFQNCAKKFESAIPGFALVEKIPIGSNAMVLAEAYETDALAGASEAAQSMMWVPTFSKIELNLQNDKIKQLYYKADSTGWPELSGETTCNVSGERVYQSLKTLLTQQEICKYESTIKESERDWSRCPVYAMPMSDAYSFSVFVPATAEHSEVKINFYSDNSIQNFDPNCVSHIKLFCSSNQGEVLDHLSKDLVDRFESYTDCVSTSVK